MSISFFSGEASPENDSVAAEEDLAVLLQAERAAHRERITDLRQRYERTQEDYRKETEFLRQLYQLPWGDRVTLAGAILQDALQGGSERLREPAGMRRLHQLRRPLQVLLLVYLLVPVFEQPSWCYGRPSQCEGVPRMSGIPVFDPLVTLFLEFSCILLFGALVWYEIRCSGGLRLYLRRPVFWRAAKLCLIGVSAVDLLFTAGLILFFPQSRMDAYVRVSPFVRPLLYIALSRRIRSLLSGLLNSVLPHVLHVLFLLGLFLAFYACFLIFTLHDWGLGGEEAAESFSSYPTSAMSVMVLLTRTNFPSVMTAAYTANRGTFLLFFPFLVLGVVFMMSIVLATVYNHYKLTLESESDDQQLTRETALNEAFELLRSRSSRQTAVHTELRKASSEESQKGWRRSGQPADGPQGEDEHDDDDDGVVDAESMLALLRELREYSGIPLFQLPSDSEQSSWDSADQEVLELMLRRDPQTGRFRSLRQIRAVRSSKGSAGISVPGRSIQDAAANPVVSSPPMERAVFDRAHFCQLFWALQEHRKHRESGFHCCPTLFGGPIREGMLDAEQESLLPRRHRRHSRRAFSGSYQSFWRSGQEHGNPFGDDFGDAGEQYDAELEKDHPSCFQRLGWGLQSCVSHPLLEDGLLLLMLLNLGLLGYLIESPAEDSRLLLCLYLEFLFSAVLLGELLLRYLFSCLWRRIWTRSPALLDIGLAALTLLLEAGMLLHITAQLPQTTDEDEGGRRRVAELLGTRGIVFLQLSWMSVLRLVMLGRMLRTFRLLSRTRRFKVLFATLGRLWDPTARIGGLLFALLYLYAAVGVLVFGGLLYPPSVSADTGEKPTETQEFIQPTDGDFRVPVAAATTTSPKIVSIQQTLYHQQGLYAFNFNDFPSALVLLFCCILNGWGVFMNAVWSVYPGAFVGLYFVSFFIVAVVILLNLVVAFVIDAFGRETLVKARALSHQRRKLSSGRRIQIPADYSEADDLAQISPISHPRDKKSRSQDDSARKPVPVRRALDFISEGEEEEERKGKEQDRSIQSSLVFGGADNSFYDLTE